MSKAPSPYFQLRSRNGISTCASGMKVPLNQATRLLASAVMATSCGCCASVARAGRGGQWWCGGTPYASVLRSARRFPMFAMPDAAELVELAASLNFRMNEKEAEQYLPLIFDAMRDLDAFVQSRAEEAAPPLLFPERGPGYRPSLTEDRYQAWLWKCAIGGRDSGLLAGRSVSFKDHISVAGIPQVFTSQALEGFIPDVDATVVTRVLSAGGKVV